MTEKVPENNDKPTITSWGDLVALGPLRRDLLPLYQRWINDRHTLRGLELPPGPMTHEQELAWYDGRAKAES